MTSYLLLRNNKESGPYTLDELVQQGLKAYDLIWVKGKSAAWRYPGEIAELKEFAPAVEEQPYDRFYKKPVEVKKEEPARVKEMPTPMQESMPVQQEQPSFTPKRSVFVTLPGQKQQQYSVKEAEQPRQHQQYQQYQPYQPPVAENQQYEQPAKTITITENPVAAEIKYSQPLDEIKEMYVRTLQERKQKLANKTFLLQSLKKIAVVLAIVGAGVLIGLSIKSNGNGKQLVVNNAGSAPSEMTSKPSIMPVQPEETVEQQLSQPTDNSNSNNSNTTQPPPSNGILSKPAPLREQRIDDNRQEQEEFNQGSARSEATKPVQKQTSIDELAPGVEINESTGERSRKTRDESDEPARSLAAEPKVAMKNSSLMKQVSVSTNEYQRVAFGGIRNLHLTVNNDSKYVLDNVTVELQYLKPSEQPLRTENIQFKSISPGGSMTIRIPDTNRGIKVNYRIIHILSTQSAKDMADL